MLRTADARLLWIQKKMKQCLSAKCRDAREAYINSSKAEKFSCYHTELCKSATDPLAVYHLSDVMRLPSAL